MREKNNGAINFAGLLSKGNVHASIDHLKALIKMAEDEGVTKINLHLFADAKDTQPHTVEEFLKEIPQAIYGEPHRPLLRRWTATATGG